MALRLVSLGQKVVATAGTRLAIIATNPQYVEAVYLSAPAANTGVVYIGDATVAAAACVEVAKGTTFTILAPKGEMIDVAKLYVDAATSGDKINISVLQRQVG